MQILEFLNGVWEKVTTFITDPVTLRFATIIILLMAIIGAVITVSKWKLYQKAGYPGWAIFIPYYSDYAYVRIAGLPWWCFLVKLLINYIFSPADILLRLILNILVGRAFGKDLPFGFGLTFVPVVFFPIIGLGKSKYLHPKLLETTKPPELTETTIIPDLPEGDK